MRIFDARKKEILTQRYKEFSTGMEDLFDGAKHGMEHLSVTNPTREIYCKFLHEMVVLVVLSTKLSSNTFQCRKRAFWKVIGERWYQMKLLKLFVEKLKVWEAVVDSTSQNLSEIYQNQW